MTKLRRLCGEVGARRTALRQRASEGSAEVVVAAVTRAVARRRPAIRRPTQACVAVTGLVPPSAWAAAAGRTSGTRLYRAESGWSPGRTARCRAQPCGFQPVEAKVLRFPQGQFLCVARIPGPRPLSPRPPWCRIARGPFDAAERRAAAARTMRGGPLFGGARSPLLPRGPQTVLWKAARVARKLPLLPVWGTPFPPRRPPRSSSQQAPAKSQEELAVGGGGLPDPRGAPTPKESVFFHK